jgi:hypothetical protein
MERNAENADQRSVLEYDLLTFVSFGLFFSFSTFSTDTDDFNQQMTVGATENHGRSDRTAQKVYNFKNATSNARKYKKR